MELWFKLDKRGENLQADYFGKRTFLCHERGCQICNLTEREKLKELSGTEFKFEVELMGIRRPSFLEIGPTFYRAHLLKILGVETIKVDEGIEFDADVAKSNTVVYKTPQGLVVVDPGFMGFNGGGPLLGKIIPEGKILGILITHGHQDHWNRLGEIGDRGPVFATRLARDLASRHASIQKDVRLERILKQAKIITPGENLSFEGNLKIETFSLPHSIPETMGLVVKGQKSRVVHLGDFKLSGWSPNAGAELVSRLTKIAREKTDVVCLNIPNAHLSGFVPSEVAVVETIKNVIAATKERVIITCFSSNLERIRRISEVANILGRPVVFYGLGMNYSQRLLKLKTDWKLKNHPVVFVTGCQAEEGSVLWRIVNGKNPPFKLWSKIDVFISSARCIPGRETELRQQYTALRLMMAELIVNEGEIEQVGLQDLYGVKEMPTHFSGHEYNGGLWLVTQTLQPKKALVWPQSSPQIEAFREIAASLGVEIFPESQRSIEI